MNSTSHAAQDLTAEQIENLMDTFMNHRLPYYFTEPVCGPLSVTEVLRACA